MVLTWSQVTVLLTQQILPREIEVPLWVQPELLQGLEAAGEFLGIGKHIDKLHLISDVIITNPLSSNTLPIVTYCNQVHKETT